MLWTISIYSLGILNVGVTELVAEEPQYTYPSRDSVGTIL